LRNPKLKPSQSWFHNLSGRQLTREKSTCQIAGGSAPARCCWRGRGSVSPSLADRIARADSAYRSLPISLSAYNSAVLEICKELETVRLSEFESSLKGLGVSFDSPKVGLPLRHVEVPASGSNTSAADAGALRMVVRLR
jgi:hypothetical protein